MARNPSEGPAAQPLSAVGGGAVRIGSGRDQQRGRRPHVAGEDLSDRQQFGAVAKDSQRVGGGKGSSSQPGAEGRL